MTLMQIFKIIKTVKKKYFIKEYKIFPNTERLQVALLQFMI